MHDIEYPLPLYYIPDIYTPGIYIGWIGVGWRRLIHASRCVSWTVTFFVFGLVLAVTTAGDRVMSFLCGENLNSAQGG